MIVNLMILPLTFISEIWFPTDGAEPGDDRQAVPGPLAGRRTPVRVRPADGRRGLNAHDIQSLVIWTAVGIFLMFRVLRQPQGEVA